MRKVLPLLIAKLTIAVFFLIPINADAQIYFSENEQIYVIPVGDTDSQLLIDEDAYGLEVDPAGEYIYWSGPATFGTEIKRARTDGSEITVIHDQSSAASGLTLDYENGKIYWIDFMNDGEIFRADLDGENPEVLIAGEPDGDTEGIQDIALDMENGHMYWVKIGAVMRADLDGENVELFVDMPDYIQPTSIDVNSRDGIVYWVDTSGDNIMMADMDSAEAEVFLDADEPSGISVDVENNMIYWMDEFFMEATGQVNVANLDGTGAEVITETDFTRGVIYGSGWEMPTSQELTAEQPSAIRLNQNYPNPFNPQTVIEFTLPQTMEISLIVYNSLGQQVSTLAENSIHNAGTHQVGFDASFLPSGIYFYKLHAGEFSLTRKMTLLK